MTHIPATEPNTLPSDPLLVSLALLFDDPLVHEAIRDLREEILRRLEEYLSGENSLTVERAIMISAQLEKARQDFSSIMIDMAMGEVIIVSDPKDFIIGKISVPCTSRWARQAFINTDILRLDVQRFVFSTFAMGRTILPSHVKEENEGPEFLLSDRQAIAAQILMVIHAAVRYRDLTVHALEAENMNSELRMLVTEANKEDLSRALDFAFELRQESHHKIHAISADSSASNTVLALHRESMTTRMSRFSEPSS